MSRGLGDVYKRQAYNTAYLDYAFKTDKFDFIEANLRGGAAALWIAENRAVYLKERKDYNDCLDRLEVTKLEV